MSLVLLRRLIPDLADMVLEYCWMETDDLTNLCIYGNHEKVSAMKKENLNVALHGACEMGYEKIINLLISNGANDWGWGLSGACLGEHVDIVELMLNYVYHNYTYYDYGHILIIICESENMEIFKLITKVSFKYSYPTLWNGSLNISCENGNMEFVNYIINNCDYASTDSLVSLTFWNSGLYGACIGEQEELAKLMIEKGADCCSCRKGNECLYLKCNKV